MAGLFIIFGLVGLAFALGGGDSDSDAPAPPPPEPLDGTDGADVITGSELA